MISIPTGVIVPTESVRQCQAVSSAGEIKSVGWLSPRMWRMSDVGGLPVFCARVTPPRFLLAAMATLNRHFDIFHERIALDLGRKERIQSAHQTLRRYVETDGPLAKVKTELFLQGSYAHGTAIRPSEGCGFDVDVVLCINAKDPSDWILELKQDASKVLDWVATRLRTVSAYNGKVRRRNRCVRIEYANDFHLDVVPAHGPSGADGGVEVPNAQSSSWIRSHPKAYNAWCVNRNDVSGGRFSRVTKYMKWWRNTQVPMGYRPKSIVLQTLVAEQIPGVTLSDAHAVEQVMRGMASRFGTSDWYFPRPDVMNPVQGSENLTSTWNEKAAFTFGQYLRRAATQAQAALQETNEARSAILWQQVLGGTFPLQA